MRFGTMVVMGMSLAGCGADVEGACNNYTDAWIACIEEAYAGDQASIDATKAAMDGTCDAYAGAKDKESADLLNCYADTIDGGDCSTAESYLTTIGGITTCGG
ncbi:MAG: hypothetical protein ABMA64_17835 [Myxococcota bacterium]